MLALSALPSCRSVEAINTNLSTLDIRHSAHTDTVVVHDSVFVREMIKGDTFYITRVEWRDRWHTRVERDTVVDVRMEKEVVQLPPERYVPKFYKRCTWALWIIVVLAIGLIGYKAIRR
jgi:hypothetical protein